MDLDHFVYRRFYERLLETEHGEERRGLREWVARVAGLFDAIAPLRHREWPPGPSTGDEESRAWHQEALFALYAVSRASDLLIERGCPAGAPAPALGTTGGRTLNREALFVHEWFFDRVGLERLPATGAFSPFHHEIFAVSTDEDADQVMVEGIVWPGFRFGDLLFCRAGVHVRAPSRLIDPEVATTSTLYFAHRREPRRTTDLADGWGGNSQYRTAFHRFYDDRDGLHLNWDGERYLGDGHRPSERDANAELPLDRRRELLLNRCFVTAPMPADEWDWFPYDDRFTLRTATWPLDADALLPDPNR
ncbi:hypothetical protein GCM10029978_096880 [Actinoallomurus acanthiterrae]